MVKFTAEELYLLINLLQENIILTSGSTVNKENHEFSKEVQKKLERELV